ncbi:hypothetical protein C8R41DRAFT_915174 [Lentinula lateritia]|uniref:Uncharacterized protein n=1 Tax=Lentinula lateritia TaxID=40482 RepID=A0ABQ8VX95_9AGAR|nr:hypothetical protein C8R41DRAFT_915174 [Lentinula lateritia]
MLLLQNTFVYCLLVTVLLRMTVFASPIAATIHQLNRRGRKKGEMAITVAWQFSGPLTDTTRFSLFFDQIGFEPVVVYDKNEHGKTVTHVQEVKEVSWQPSPTNTILLGSTVKTSSLVCRFGDSADFRKHIFDTIKDVQKLQSQTMALLEGRHKEFGTVLTGPELNSKLRQHPIIEDDLDWINTVLLFLSLTDLPMFSGGPAHVSPTPLVTATSLETWNKKFNSLCLARYPSLPLTHC